MGDIVALYNECKSELERKQFLEAQHKTIVELLKKNAQLTEEVGHLKQLLVTSTSIVGEPRVEKVIVTPEEALIDTQIEILQAKGIDSELDLEDIKKFDLLLKNKQLIKDKAIKAESRPVFTTSELLTLVRKLPSPSAPS